ncbi:hypothetical protein, partial [Aeromonas caviae]|uniref:hypothetical protein n=1 Tax=Aeromonas caviae TaxID=648 RepID=UPI001CC5B2D3
SFPSLPSLFTIISVITNVMSIDVYRNRLPLSWCDHDTDGPGGNQLDEGGMSDGVHKGKFRDKG